MRQEDDKKLLSTLRELAIRDAVVEAFLSLAEVEIRAELQEEGFRTKELAKDFIDEILIQSRLIS